MSDEILNILREQIDPMGCRVINRPERIWVFGGSFRDNSDDCIKSLRDSFLSRTFTQTGEPTSQAWFALLEKPEDYPEWTLLSDQYTDLLEFERDACYLARGTILFAESAGSLVELGALTIDSDLVKTLLVVIESKYTNELSFINLGPIRRLRSHNKAGLSVIDSVAEGASPDLSRLDFESIVSQITQWLPANIAKQTFGVNNRTHILLLLADLVDLLGATSEPILQKLTEFFNIKIDATSLNKALALLHFFKLIIKEQRGNENYYVRNQRSQAPWLDYKGKDITFDRSRFKIQCETVIRKTPRLNSLLERAHGTV